MFGYVQTNGIPPYSASMVGKVALKCFFLNKRFLKNIFWWKCFYIRSRRLASSAKSCGWRVNGRRFSPRRFGKRFWASASAIPDRCHPSHPSTASYVKPHPPLVLWRPNGPVSWAAITCSNYFPAPLSNNIRCLLEHLVISFRNITSLLFYS